MSDIISSEYTNVDQVIVDSPVENCNKILLDAASESEMFTPLNRETKLLKRLKKPGLIRNVLSSVKNILKLGIQVGELNQLKIELILFVVVKHTERRLISSTMHIEMILFLSYVI